VAVASGSPLTAAPQLLQKRLLGGTSEPQETQRMDEIAATGEHDHSNLGTALSALAGTNGNDGPSPALGRLFRES
jgi:hypothetical protein